MSRPDSVTNEDILRWSENIDNDPKISVGLAKIAILREVMYAGLWLAEKLDNYGCPLNLIPAIQFEAGRYSFGRDPWEASQKIFDMYVNNELQFTKDYELN